MTIDGIKVLNTSNSGTQFIGVSVHTAADVTIENSVFFSTGPNGTNEDRAINLDTTAQGHVVIANNLVTGDATGQFSTASWHPGIWSDGAASQLDVTGNTFENVRSGMNLDGYDDAHTNVSGNTFANGGTAFAIGTPVTSAITGIHDNTFKDVGDDFNLKNVDAAHPQSFDADATHNIAVASGGDSVGVLLVLGTLGADTLTGTAGVDVLDAADLPDGIHDSASNTLHGLGGDDILLGSDGNDTLDGGAGNDTLVGGAGNDTAVYTAIVDSSNITDDGSHFVVAAGGGEGTDTLSGIEKIGGAGAPNILLVGRAAAASSRPQSTPQSTATSSRSRPAPGPKTSRSTARRSPSTGSAASTTSSSTARSPSMARSTVRSRSPISISMRQARTTVSSSRPTRTALAAR